MTDSLPPPPGPKPTPSIFPPAKEDGQQARIEFVTGDLRDVKRPLRLAGQVIGENRDGTIRVHTARGDVDLRLRGQSELPEGIPVEVDIPPGRPPRMAVIRSVPEDAPAAPRGTGGGTTAQSAPPETPDSLPVRERGGVQPQPLPVPPRNETGEATPSPERLPPVPYTPPSLPPEDYIPPEIVAAPRPLEISDTVRLLPLPPQQAAQIVRPVPEILNAVVTPLPEALILKAVLIAADAVDEQARQIVRPDAQPVPVAGDTPSPVTGAPVAPSYAPPAPPLEQIPVSAASVPDVLPIATARPDMSVPVISIVSLPELPVAVEPSAVPVLPALPVASLLPAMKPAVILSVPEAVQKSISTVISSPSSVSPVSSAPMSKVEDPLVTIAPVAAPRAASFIPALLSTAPVTATIPAPPLLHHMPVFNLPAVPSPQNMVTTSPAISSPVVPTIAPLSVKPQPLDIGVVKIIQPGVRIIPALPVNTPVSAVVPPPSSSAVPEAVSGPNPFIAQIMQTAAPAPDAPALPSAPTLQKAAFAPDMPISLPAGLKSVPAPVPELQIPAPPLLVQEKPAAAIAPVIGHTPQNLPVLSVTPPGAAFPQAFVLQFGASNLPAGTLVEFIPQPGGVPYHAAFPTAETVAGAPILPTPIWPLLGSFDWPVLDDVQQILQQQGAAQVLESLARTVPNPGNPARMPAAALFFLAAVRSGDIAGWLGDKAMDVLRRAGRADIATRGARDFAGLQRASSEPVAQDWRGVALPMAWQDDMHKAILYFRRSGSEDDKEQGGGFGTRFIFDLDLPRMGAVQLDGLHRTKRLDLIVRSRLPFSEPMQQAMRRAWVGALEQTALSGELSFQSKPSQFVKIDLPADSRGIRV